MTVTLADVAARAQVSPATVSRVLNGNYPVAASTRERVLRAVDELDYVLNGPASALAAATSDLVGILVNDIADPFFGIMAGAIQGEIGGRGAGPAGSGSLSCATPGGSPERELTYLTLLQRQRAAAVVLTGGAVENTAHAEAVATKLRKLADAGTRVVLCGRPPAPAGHRRGRAHLRQPGRRAAAHRASDRASAIGGWATSRARRSGRRPGIGWRATGTRSPRTASPTSRPGPCTGGTTAGPGTRRRSNCCAATRS